MKKGNKEIVKLIHMN